MRAALFRLLTAAQPGFRPVLAFRGRHERVRSSKRKPDLAPRVSLTSLPLTQRPARHADRVGRCVVVAVRRCGAGARTYAQRMDRRSPDHARTPGVALLWLHITAQSSSRPMLAFRERDERVGCVGSSGHPKRVSL